MPPKNKSSPLCVTTTDRAILKNKLLARLSTHTTLHFPSPSISPTDRRIPLHIQNSLSTYTPFSSLLSTVHKAPLKLPLTSQQWHWLRKFCYASFFYRGASTSGFQELVPRDFLRLSAVERAFVKGELGKANGQARAKMVPQGAMAVAIYFLLKGGFFPPTPDQDEDTESLFIPSHPKTAAETEPIPFTSYTEHRRPYWRACLDAEPWIAVWWMSKCVGHMIDVAWIWQTKPETDPKLATLKSDLQEEIPEALIKLVDSVYLNLIDHDVNAGGGIWGESGGGSGNAGVNATLSKLFTHSKHKLDEWPVYSSKIEEIRETRDLWDEACRYNKEMRNDIAAISTSSSSLRSTDTRDGEEAGEDDYEDESGSDEESESESESD
ncbi:hypothetical protein BKA64DRAFT_748082 [Cadophora sp. MPI-SDFR-AT-0126]|nr:hypothetical protein BKA64DRAFT_748082 [Leotiomycetes sp. MPI-SDFR-AT-0126]